jgi:hypothetical protein
MITYSQCHGDGHGYDYGHDHGYDGDDDVSFEFSLNKGCKNKESWLKGPGFGYPRRGFALLKVH